MKLIYWLTYWIYHATSALWSWSQRRFTMAGSCVVGGFIVAGATGVDIENTVTYQSFTLLLGFLLLALAGSFFFRGEFSATRLLPRVATAGQPFRYRVTIRNLTAKDQTGLTVLENLANPRPSFADWLGFQLARRRAHLFPNAQRGRNNPLRPAILKESEVPPLLARDEAEASMEVLPLRRGILRFSSLILAQTDAFGLFRSFIRVRIEQKVLILPRRYPIPPIALPGAGRYLGSGMALASTVRHSDEIFALREYRHGDPLRHIHWRSWAKTGKPMVKEFEDEFLVRHALVLDTFGDETNSEVLEEAVSVAASFAFTVLAEESRLDLFFVGNQSYCFTAGRGFGRADQILEILASATNYANKNFEVLEQLVLNHVSEVSGCICVLQNWDEARKRFVGKLRGLGLPLLVLVVTLPGQIKLDAGPLGDQPECLQVLEIGDIAEQLAKLR